MKLSAHFTIVTDYESEKVTLNGTDVSGNGEILVPAEILR